MNEVQWGLTLINRLTGPARQMESSVRRLSAMQDMATGQTRKFGAALAHLKGPGSVAVNTLNGVRNAVAGVSALAFAATGGAIGAGIKSIIDAAGYKEQTLISFRSLLGDAGIAANVYAHAVKFAAATPFDTPGVIDATKQLLSYGFATKDLESVLTSAGNVASGMGKPLEQAVTAFAALKSGDFGQAFGVGQGFNQLGITKKQLEAAGLKFDKSGSYKGSVENAMTAVQNIIKTKFGTGMAAQSKSIFGLVSTLQSRPFELFSNIDTSGGLEPVKKLLSNLSDLTDFSKSPGNKIASRFNKSVGGLFKAVFGGLATATSGANGEKFVAGIIGSIDRLSSFITKEGPGIVSGFKVVFGAVSTGLSLAVSAVKLLAPYVPALVAFFAVLKGAALLVSLQGAMIAVGGLTGVLPALGMALTAVGGPWGLLIAAVVAGVVLLITNWSRIRPFLQPVLDWIVTAFNNVIRFFQGLPLAFSTAFTAVTTFFQGLPAQFAMFGANLIMGLVNGITSRIASVKDAIVGAANSAVGWFKGVLGIASPSKVFMSLGTQLPAGLEQGIRSGQGKVTKAISALGVAATVSGAFAMPDNLQANTTRAVAGIVAPVSSSVSANQGGAGGARSIALTVNVSGQPGTGQATLDAYSTVTVDALRDALEMYGLEVSGG